MDNNAEDLSTDVFSSVTVNQDHHAASNIMDDIEERPTPNQLPSSDKMDVGNCPNVKTIYTETISKLVFIFKDEVAGLNNDEEVVNIRKRLDEYFVEGSSQKRHALVDLFVSNYRNTEGLGNEVNLDLCLAFYNWVLDESFTTFDLADETFDNVKNHPFHIQKEIFSYQDQYRSYSKFYGEPGQLHRIDPLKLLHIICQRSPNMETLKLSFDFPGQSVVLDLTFGQMLLKLESLTSLTLSWDAGRHDCVSFF